MNHMLSPQAAPLDRRQHSAPAQHAHAHGAASNPAQPYSRVVIYDASVTFGGHEVMTLLGLRALLAQETCVAFIYAAANKKLASTLQELQQQYPSLQLRAITPGSRKLQTLRNLWEKSRLRELTRIFASYSPELILVAQGDLELSSEGVLAGLALRKRREVAGSIPVVSYVPFAHGQATMGAKLGRLRDFVGRAQLNAPDAFITLSHQAASQLRARGSRRPVYVVYNGIDLSKFTPAARLDQAARVKQRQLWGCPPNKRLVALCGRLEMSQKGQALVLQALHQSRWLRDSVHLLLVGDGPDEARLKRRVRQLQLEAHVTFTGWCDPAPIYPALDALVIASRYEGMPLAMLEAIASGTPVVAVDRDGMREVLPRAWRFLPGSASALAQTLRTVLQTDNEQQLRSLTRLVTQTMSVEGFQKSFCETLLLHCQELER